MSFGGKKRCALGTCPIGRLLWAKQNWCQAGQGAVVERPQPRTLLERLIQQNERTLEETCRDFEQCARLSRERATLSVRQLGRWMAGGVDNARPASRRTARQFWGHSFKQLLGPPDVSVQVVTPTTVEATTVVQAASRGYTNGTEHVPRVP